MLTCYSFINYVFKVMSFLSKFKFYNRVQAGKKPPDRDDPAVYRHK